jgi:hypothetical protein
VAAAPTAAPTAAPPDVSCRGGAAVPVDQGAVLQALASGIENERFVALMEARAAALVLPPHLLQALFESDPSERVRFAAFEDYLALYAERADVLRSVLTAAQQSPSPELRRAATRRLTELTERERLAALPPVADP